MEQSYSSKRLKIVRCYYVLVLKYTHTDAHFQQFKIQNKKQSL